MDRELTPVEARSGVVSGRVLTVLVLSSLGICMLTTFEAFAARDGIEILRWDATASGTVERTPEGLMFTSIVLGIDMEIAGSVERWKSAASATVCASKTVMSAWLPTLSAPRSASPNFAAGRAVIL